MIDQFRIKPQPVVEDRQGAGRSAVAAQPGNYLAGLPQGSTELQGLVRGLSVLNPALEGFALQQQKEALQKDAEARKAAALAGKAAAQVPDVPRDALTGAPIERPVSVPPAHGDIFQAAVREGLAERVGVQNKVEAVAAYHDLKDTEGFNPRAWLTEQRQKALQGITDEATIVSIGRQFTELEGHMQVEMERERIAKREAAVNSTLTSLSGDMFTANMRGEELADAYQVFLDKARASGKTGKEASQYLFAQVVAQSARMGGMPEMFDVFEHRSQDGQLIGAHMRPQIEDARKAASQARDKELMQRSEQFRAKTLIGYESDLDNAPDRVTMERLIGDMTQFGAVQSPEQAASLWNRAQDAMRGRLATEQLQAQWGNLFRLTDPGVQNKLLDSRLNPLMDQFLEAEKTGDARALQLVTTQMLTVHSEGRPSVPWTQLKNYIKTFTANATAAEGPSTGFQAGVALYRSMSKMPQYRDLYFDENSRQLMDSYIGAVDTGTDAKVAYVQAHQAVSPEAKAAAEAFAKTPEFAKMVQKDAEKHVSGSSWIPRMLGGNGRPENQGYVGAALSSAMRAHRARNPATTDAQMESFAETWTKQNFVLDTETGTAIKVPPALGGEAAAEAFSAMTKRLTSQLQLGGRSDSKWGIQYVPTGTEGEYNIVAFNGSAMTPVAKVSLQSMLAAEAQRKALSPEELATIGAAKKALEGGTLIPMTPDLLAKAEALGALRGSEVSAYKAESAKVLKDRINSVPKMSFGAPSFDSIANIRTTPGKVDHKLTAQTSLEILGTPMLAWHTAAAASLITAGEGVVLQAYDDPAKGAGRNIGTGYNLEANASKVYADLKQAGVPQERIQDVVEGRASLTPEQSKRLTLVALPRYEKQAQQVADSTSPGLWQRMTATQKAVMIDVAWQTGDPAQFKKAWGSLASGDGESFSSQTKVYYTDRSGVRKEDTRRNNLRASMLAGLGHWQTGISKYGSFPSTKLQALQPN